MSVPNTQINMLFTDTNTCTKYQSAPYKNESCVCFSDTPEKQANIGGTAKELFPLNQILNQTPPDQFDKASEEGLKIFEAATNDMKELLSTGVDTRHNETQALESIGESALNNIDDIFACGSHCFVFPDKEKDNDFSKQEFFDLVIAKVRKDFDFINKLVASEIRPEHRKKLTLAYTGLRTMEACVWLLNKLPDKVRFTVGTRGPHKVSVANYSLNALDIGSAMVQLVLSVDIPTIEKIIDVAVQLLREDRSMDGPKAMGVTGGSYEERKQSAESIKNIIREFYHQIVNGKDLFSQHGEKPEDVLKAVYRFVQPIHPNVEKACILDQREWFNTKPCLVLQSGNKDGLIAMNDGEQIKVVASISVSEDEEEDKRLFEWAEKLLSKKQFTTAEK